MTNLRSKDSAEQTVSEATVPSAPSSKGDIGKQIAIVAALLLAMLYHKHLKGPTGGQGSDIDQPFLDGNPMRQYSPAKPREPKILPENARFEHMRGFGEAAY